MTVEDLKDNYDVTLVTLPCKGNTENTITKLIVLYNGYDT